MQHPYWRYRGKNNDPFLPSMVFVGRNVSMLCASFLQLSYFYVVNN